MRPIEIMQVDSKRSAGKLEQMRKKPNHHAIILYYRNGCPPCDKMKPAWDAACDKFGKRYKCKTREVEVVIANVDPTGFKFLEKMDSKFHKINGTPSLKHSSSAGVVSEFNDNRDEAKLMEWLQKSLHDVIVDAHETDANVVDINVSTGNSSTDNSSTDNSSTDNSNKNPQIKTGGGGCWLKDMFKTRKYRRGNRRSKSNSRGNRSSKSNNRSSRSNRLSSRIKYKKQ